MIGVTTKRRCGRVLLTEHGASWQFGIDDGAAADGSACGEALPAVLCHRWRLAKFVVHWGGSGGSLTAVLKIFFCSLAVADL